MEIKTKFAIGDKLWTIPAYAPTLKPVCFEVVSILYCDGIQYGSGGEIYHYETWCFATKDELIEHIINDGN